MKEPSGIKKRKLFNIFCQSKKSAGIYVDIK